MFFLYTLDMQILLLLL